MSNIYKLDTGFDKLKGYTMCNFSSLCVGDHFRYTSNKYKDEGRKISYGVVKSVNEDFILVNGYNPDGIDKYADWEINPSNKYKNYVFYKKRKDVSLEDKKRKDVSLEVKKVI